MQNFSAYCNIKLDHIVYVALSQIPMLSKLTLQLKFNDILLFEPSPGPQGWGKKCGVACSIHVTVSNSHTIIVWILSNCLGGDSISDIQMEGQTEAITISPTL